MLIDAERRSVRFCVSVCVRMCQSRGVAKQFGRHVNSRPGGPNILLADVARRLIVTDRSSDTFECSRCGTRADESGLAVSNTTNSRTRKRQECLTGLSRAEATRDTADVYLVRDHMSDRGSTAVHPTG